MKLRKSALLAVLLGCAKPVYHPPQPQQPPAPPARPTQHAEVSTTCEPWTEDEGDGVIRGLVIEKGPDGAPAIHVALFKQLQQWAGGHLEFDEQALAKLKGELSGSSTTSDYSLSVKDSLNRRAPLIELQGVWRRVKTLDETVSYADLVGTAWSCRISPPENLGYYDGEKVQLGACVHGKRMVKADLLDGPADEFQLCRENEDDPRHSRPWKCYPQELVTYPRPSGETRLASVKKWAQAYDKKWGECDPTGAALPAFNRHQLPHDDRENAQYQLAINVFTPSHDPLYPGTDYFNAWGYVDAPVDNDETKTAFQIYWLVVQQKAKSGVKW